MVRVSGNTFFRSNVHPVKCTSSTHYQLLLILPTAINIFCTFKVACLDWVSLQKYKSKTFLKIENNASLSLNFRLSKQIEFEPTIFPHILYNKSIHLMLKSQQYLNVGCRAVLGHRLIHLLFHCLLIPPVTKNLYPPVTRKRRLRLYFGRVRTHLGVVYIQAFRFIIWLLPNYCFPFEAR